MHYYQFNIGDYSSHTSRLNLYEDLAYRRLLDLYYLNERPFNGCSTDVARDIGMLDSLGDVEFVLNKFFTEKDGIWYNKRCDSEIKAYQDKRKTASKAGKASAKARRSKADEQMNNDRSTTVQPNIKHKPITINQETLTKKQETRTNNHKPEDQKIISSRLDGIVESQVLLNYLNDISGKSFKHVESNLKLIKARLSEGHSEKEIYAVIDRKVTEWQNDPKMAKYIRPATLFNAEKFNQYVGELGVETPDEKNDREMQEWINEGLDEGITEGDLYEH